jgi:hypothetical protein
MSKLSKETILPLAAMMTGIYTDQYMKMIDSTSSLWSETMYTNGYSTSHKSSTLTKKQIKVRNKNKAAKKARKKNRK